MNIRQAKTSDAAAIAPLFNQYREFYRQASDLQGAEAFLKARLENHESVILIAEENGEFTNENWIKWDIFKIYIYVTVILTFKKGLILMKKADK